MDQPAAQTKLLVTERAALQALVESHGEAEAARRTGVARATLVRAAGGFSCSERTARTLRTFLAGEPNADTATEGEFKERRGAWASGEEKR